MEFLDNFVLPQSAEHIELLHYMLIVVLFLFIPFISIVFGGTFLSVFFKRKWNKTNDEHYFKLAKDVIEIVTINKSVGFILGIVPLVTCILIYSQLLHGSDLTNLNYLTIALVLIAVSLVLIYSYRYSLSFKSIFISFRESVVKDPEVLDDLSKLTDESNRISRKAGYYGLLFLFFGLWFFTVGITIPSLLTEWKVENVIEGFFSWKVILRFIYLILFALSLTGGMILFSFFEASKSKKEKDENYSSFVKGKIVKFTFSSAVVVPVFSLVNLFVLPDKSLSGSVFFYLIISLVFLFLGYHFLYLLTKDTKGIFAALLFFTLIFSVAANIISDQKAMANSTKIRTAVLSTEYDKYLADLKGEGKTVELSGAEIYQVKCGSCHKFDQKLVGPPHKEVIPKYIGKEAQLIAFIRNPVKVNPEYPPMPNPGLKPNEAEAIAKYLLDTIKTITK